MDEAGAVCVKEPPQKLHVAIVFEVEQEPGHWRLGWPWDWAGQNINAGSYATTCLHHRCCEIAAATPELPEIPSPRRAGVHHRLRPRLVLLSAGWQTEGLKQVLWTRILPAVYGQLLRERALLTLFSRSCRPGPGRPWLRMRLPLCRHGRWGAIATTWHATRTSGCVHLRHDQGFVHHPMAL